MLRRSIRMAAALTAWVLAAMLLAGPARAIGYFNLPGNFCQCFGYGCGPGYHAPMVLGPVSVRGCCAHPVDRLWHAPAPPYGCTGWGSGCSECGCDPGAPSMLEAVPVPAAESLPMPTPLPEAVPSAFRAPWRF